MDILSQPHFQISLPLNIFMYMHVYVCLYVYVLINKGRHDDEFFFHAFLVCNFLHLVLILRFRFTARLLTHRDLLRAFFRNSLLVDG